MMMLIIIVVTAVVVGSACVVVHYLLQPVFHVVRLANGRYAVMCERRSGRFIGWQAYQSSYDDRHPVHNNFGDNRPTIEYKTREKAREVADNAHHRYSTGRVRRDIVYTAGGDMDDLRDKLLEDLGRACATGDHEMEELLLKQYESHGD